MQIDSSAAASLSAFGTGARQVVAESNPPPRPAGSPDGGTSGSHDVVEAMRKVAFVMREKNIALNFSTDEETGSIVVRMIDETTGETIRQIPDDALLHLASVLGRLQGQVFDRRA